ncbi:RNA polymerase subunit sigma-70 [Variovorax sp. KBW07]|uniref:RNA polymerase sigma factor n=1 Tax=Variovorax sp. KBW07 TaxID=2153358 RepID=UPI000F567AA1|nr:sigma-70 family RNA polymerase sigma factor [Variovorax sp. KBW07]RQO60221.1 RNA polymerase subunit sigma-70 [Variovorax sp. KBW07]
MALSVLCEPQAAAGDPAANEPLDEAQRRLALQGFLCANYEGLCRKLARHLGCADMASECLHDAWLRLGDLEVRSPVLNPSAYIYRVACNAAMDRMRGDRSWQYTGDADMGIEHFADHTPGPERIAQARSDLAAVQRAMERLPRRHRSVLVALRIDEMTRDEVASRYALSVRGVDTALRQALDYCAGSAGQQVLAGVSAPRRALRPQGMPVSA